MIQPLIVCIVEGEGDRIALPALIGRLCPSAIVPQPIKARRNQITKRDMLGKFLSYGNAAIAEKNREGVILIVVDADDDCPADLGPRILQDACALLPTRKCFVVLAKRMYETWLVAGGVAGDTAYADDIESVANPKVILQSTFGHYKETVDQLRLTRLMDPSRARSGSPSFDKMCRTVEEICVWFDSAR